MYVIGKYGEYHDVKRTEDIAWVSQTATCSSIIYVYRVYMCLCIFRNINWQYMLQIAIILLYFSLAKTNYHHV